MKVLITGATGFVGNYVVSEMFKRSHSVIATSRNAAKASLCEWFSKVTYIARNLNDAHEDYYRFFGEPDVLIHLAWEGLPNYTDVSHFERNLFSNYFFLKNMVEHGLKNLVVTGTCFEYGMKNGALHEDMETNPQNSYGLAKDTCTEKVKTLLPFFPNWTARWKKARPVSICPAASNYGIICPSKKRLSISLRSLCKAKPKALSIAAGASRFR
jgi:UDP-glucose 4-epimerase